MLPQSPTHPHFEPSISVAPIAAMQTASLPAKSATMGAGSGTLCHMVIVCIVQTISLFMRSNEQTWEWLGHAQVDLHSPLMNPT